MPMNEDNRKYLKKALDFSALGLEMGISVIIGVYAGHMADNHFDIAPWGTLFGIALGLGAAGMTLYKAFLRLRKMESPSNSDSELP